MDAKGINIINIYIYRELEDPGSLLKPTDALGPKNYCRDCSGVDSGYQGSITLSYLGQAALRIPAFEKSEHPIPIGSIYGIFAYIWLIFMVNVGKYTIHGSSGI